MAAARVVAVGAMLGVVAGCAGGGDATHVPGDTPGVSPSDSASPGDASSPTPVGPQPSPPAPGAFPVPALPASAVPWSDVGPGWFVVLWTDSTTSHQLPVLVDPDGNVYSTVVDVDDPGWSMDWTHDGLAYFRSTVPDGEEYGEWASGDVTIVDLRTGAAEKYASNIDDPGWKWETKDGTHVGLMYPGDGTQISVTKDGKSLGRYCWGYARTGLSPDGKHLVCLWGRKDGGTNVTLAGVTGPASEKVIDVFSRGVFDYSIAGWLDSKRFLLRRPVEGTYEDHIVWKDGMGWPRLPAGDGAKYFAYDVSARKIADFTLPFRGDYGEVQFDWPSEVYWATPWDDPRADFFSASGTAIATVDCDEIAESSEPPSVVMSGRRAIVTCWSSYPDGHSVRHASVLVNLDEGTTTVLGPTPGDQASGSATVFPYPESY